VEHKLKKRWRSDILETVKYIKTNSFSFVFMSLFDFLFLLFIGLLNILIRDFINPSSAVFVLLGYYLLAILVYSFCNFVILNLINKVVKNIRFGLKGLLEFFGLNFIIINSLFAIFLALAALVYSVISQEYKTIIIRIIFVLFVMLAYPLLNLTHSFFIHGFSIKESIKKGAYHFTKVNSYLAVYGFGVFLIAAFFLLYSIIGFLLKRFLYDWMSSYYNAYALVFSVITLLVLYFILAFNRIYFYVITDKGG